MNAGPVALEVQVRRTDLRETRVAERRVPEAAGLEPGRFGHPTLGHARLAQIGAPDLDLERDRSGVHFAILIERSRNSFVYVLFTSNGLSTPMYSTTRS